MPQNNTPEDEKLGKACSQCLDCKYLLAIERKDCLFALYAGFEDCFNWNIMQDCKRFESNESD